MIKKHFFFTDFSRDEDGESPSPPSRPRSHAPWIYPSDIQIGKIEIYFKITLLEGTQINFYLACVFNPI